MKKIKITGLLLTALFISNTGFADDRIVTKLYDDKTQLDVCTPKVRTVLDGKFIQIKKPRTRVRKPPRPAQFQRGTRPSGRHRRGH
jgi:hypothetical protein